MRKSKKTRKFEINIYKKPVLRINLILMQIRIQILDPYWKEMDPDPGQDFLNFFNQKIFYSKTWWTIQKWGNFYNLSFSKILIWGFGLKKIFFCIFLVDISPLGSESVDADPDPGSQNLAYPNEPDLDPNRCKKLYQIMMFRF